MEPRTEPEPTTALPGTEAKVAVMAERATLGLPLWHERDARLGYLEPYEDRPGGVGVTNQGERDET